MPMPSTTTTNFSHCGLKQTSGTQFHAPVRTFATVGEPSVARTKRGSREQFLLWLSLRLKLAVLCGGSRGTGSHQKVKALQIPARPFTHRVQYFSKATAL